MKKLLFCLLLLAGFTVNAQVYNNEWIDYSKTYYKFKVGKTGLHRIPQTTLAAAGLGNTSAEHFQLWRNGVEVPIYTSVQTGSLSTTDYIEFWGEMNDGKPDKQLYRQPEYQLNDKWSLQTDTATYFLTINPSTNNLRLTPTANNVAGNTLAPEPYFMHTVGTYFKNRINPGRGVPVGSMFYSSSYDYGEGYSSSDIGMNATHTASFPNLFVYPSGPDPKIKIAVSGNDNNCRRYKLDINSDSVLGNQVNFFNYSVDSTTFALSKLSSNTASLIFRNIQVYCDTSDHHVSDRMVIHKYELTYPRQFNFGGANTFEFFLPSSINGNYLEIKGFSYGTQPPVLLDITNGKRYLGDISTAATVKIALEPSATERRLVLVTQATTGATNIASLQSRNFTDYKLAQNQADYLIISNPLLFSDASGANPVEDYRQYRSSVNGGNYNAKIFLIEDLVDQFAFGIKKHPMAIRNFVQFARNQFSVAPKHVFLIGKAVNYISHRGGESNVNMERVNLVPTFGSPASDALLTADPGNSFPKTPVGRLSAVNAQEVAVYLKKVKDYEATQKVTSSYLKDKEWMKNVVHVVGSSEPGLQAILDRNMNTYTGIVSDTLFGAKVYTFTKSSANAVQQINNGQLDRLFEEGISLITYFGHSSSTTLEFNLNTPDQYNNYGKYPMFNALGCSVGDNYAFSNNRLSAKSTLSESFVMAEDRGSIGFIASSFLGIVHYLDIYNERFYNALTKSEYGKSIGEIIQSAIAQTYAHTSQEDFYARGTCEEIALNGDPAIRLNTHEKPDYAIEEPQLSIKPSIVSVADQFFRLKARFVNLGRAINESIAVEVKREYPDKSSEIILKDTIPGIRYADSIILNIPIETLRDKGENKLTVTIDADNNVDELYESNNSITKSVFIFEDEARPVYPYEFAIVNKNDIKLLASTANPFSTRKEYKMELDTTELFNSTFKLSRSVSSGGGIIEFSPGVAFTDSTVYYWRVGLVPDSGDINWHSSSFVYLPDHDIGFSQSHIYQHFKSEGESIFLDSASGKWEFNLVNNDLFVRHGTWASSTGQEAGVSVYVNGERIMNNACARPSLVFNVFSPQTFKPWDNPTGGLYGSVSNTCFPGRQYNFEYKYTDTASRRKIMEFMKNIVPDGYYVLVRNFALAAGTPGAYAPDWMADTSLYGSNVSLYHYMREVGFSGIDSFYRTRPWIFIYKKNDLSFTPKWEMAEGTLDNITLSANCLTSNTLGYINSPLFGPASEWRELNWSGSMIGDEAGDEPVISLLGIRPDGSVDTLRKDIGLNLKTVDLSSVDAAQYPFLQLRMRNRDTLNNTPFQLKSWRLTYVPSPEGAIAPNIYFSIKDTLEIGEPLDFKIAFKNISEAGFDSLRVKMIITDRNNVSHEIPVVKHRPLGVSDTLHVRHYLDTKQFVGNNTLYVDINPDNDQPEQYHFNNFLYRNFYVVPDTLHPVIDVTFDREHILNGDIVSAKPEILIKLKDEAKWMMVDSSSLVTVKLLYPNSSVARVIHFDNDTLRFEPPQQTSGSSQNTASIHFNPTFEEDGNYELIVTAKDRSENQAGTEEYRIGFKVINKPMISNMLNYPNPFTTSTAFVFTLTGSEVPQNLKIQILTVTGKVVREITKQELGPLRIGRNITEFKWDGTDQYGQRLANGVYLYRVVTNLNGKSLDKYDSGNDDTDKYFNKGYGKMYLMR